MGWTCTSVYRASTWIMAAAVRGVCVQSFWRDSSRHSGVISTTTSLRQSLRPRFWGVKWPRDRWSELQRESIALLVSNSRGHRTVDLCLNVCLEPIASFFLFAALGLFVMDLDIFRSWCPFTAIKYQCFIQFLYRGNGKHAALCTVDVQYIHFILRLYCHVKPARWLR